MFVGCISRRHWEYISYSHGRWDYYSLSRWRWEYDALSMRWEHDSLSIARCEYETFSAICLCYYATIMLTAAWRGATKKTTIDDTDNCQLTTLVNSASTTPPIGLPPKGAKFCHTSNILLVGCWCRHTLSWHYFTSSVVVGCWLVHNKGCQA